MLDAIFGGSVSSRLFREVREKRGLAYSVGSYTEQFMDRGTVAMYVGTRPENVDEACEIIGRELVRLRDLGVSEEELARAKEHVKGRMVLSLESTGARMTRLARGTLFGVPLLSLDEMLARVEAVGVEDLNELARELYDPDSLAAACVGPREQRFRRAAGRVSEALLAMIDVVVSGAAGRMGGDGLCGGRGRRGHASSRAAPTPGWTSPLEALLDRAEVVVDFIDPGRRARQRGGVPGGRRARGGRDHRLRPRRAARGGGSGAGGGREGERASSPPTSRSGRC